MTIDELRSRASEIAAELDELAEKDELTEDEDTRFDALVDESQRVAADIEKLEKRQKARDEVRYLVESGQAHVDAGSDERNDPERPAAGQREKRLWDLDEIRTVSHQSPEKAHEELRSRATEVAEKTRGLTDRQRQHLTDFVERLDPVDDDETSGNIRALRHIVATSSPEYRRQFNRWMKAGLKGMRDGDAETYLTRAASLTDAAGGYAVPLPIDPTLVINDDGTTNPFREISTTKQITTDQLRTVNSTAVSGSWDGEAAEVSDDTPTWANTDISVHKAQVFVPYSIEIGQDYPDLAGDIGMLIANEKDDLEAAAFATGSGSNQPVGIVTALTGGSYEVSSNTTDTFALADVYDLEEELPAKFRRRAVWVANKRIYQAMREAGGQNLDDFWANLGQGQPNELLGYPTFESSEMDGTVTATSDNYVLVFGDFANYWIVDRVGLSIELVPHLFATGNNRPSGQRGWYAYWRVGADSVNDRAFRLLNVT